MKIGRRSFVLGATAALASPLAAPFIKRASASQGAIVMASWGGAVAKMYQEDFADPFARDTGISATVDAVPEPSAAVASAMGRPQHNVVVATSAQVANLAQRGLIDEFTVDDMPNIRHIPEQYWVRDDSGRILGMPIYFTYYGIAYNANLTNTDELATWDSLTEDRWKGRISINRPIYLSTYDLTLYSKVRGGDENNIDPGIPLLKGIAANAVSMYSSSPTLLQQLSLGEVVAAPFYSQQVQAIRRAGQHEVSITLPKEGGLLLSYLLTVPKGAQDRDTALRFINEAIDPNKQIAASRNGYLPLTDNVTLPDEILKELVLPMEEVRERNWSPNWHVVATHFEDRVRLVEGIVEEATSR